MCRAKRKSSHRPPAIRGARTGGFSRRTSLVLNAGLDVGFAGQFDRSSDFSQHRRRTASNFRQGRLCSASIASRLGRIWRSEAGRLGGMCCRRPDDGKKQAARHNNAVEQLGRCPSTVCCAADCARQWAFQTCVCRSRWVAIMPATCALHEQSMEQARICISGCGEIAEQMNLASAFSTHVIFDFGGVITSSPFEAFNRMEAERGLPHDLSGPGQQHQSR